MEKPLVLDRFKAIDLTHPLHEGVPTWSGGCGFGLEIKLDYEQGLRVQSLRGHAGVGTHMDAPSHFIKGSWNIDEIPLESLIVSLCVLNLQSKRSPDLLITPEEIAQFEKLHKKIPQKSLVLAYTGWDEFWTVPLRYRNPDPSGKMHFPGFSADAASLLIERGVSGIGIDTLSPDGSNEGFPVHEQMLGAKKYILENVAHLSQMPPVGAYAIALPLRVQGATESGTRLVGLIPQSV